MPDHNNPVLGVILAGGASRRFGAHKTAALLGGRALLERVVERARPQVDSLMVNANDAVLATGGIQWLADAAPGEGPIAGILAALSEAKKRGFARVASFACDTPFFPTDTVARLAARLGSSNADYSLARCNGNAHRIFALWPIACRMRLEDAFASGARSMREIETSLTPAFADFPHGDGPGGDPFFNINTPEDLEAAERWLSLPSRPQQY